MGLCCPDSKTKKELKSQFKESICRIKSRNGLKGIGFFSTISFPKNGNKINVLITSSKLISEYDLTNENIIELHLKNSNKTIKMNIDNNRKFYSDYKNQISIIELLENDQLKNIEFLNLVSLTPYNLYKNEPIFLLCFNNDPKNSLEDQYITGNINKFSYENDNNIFTFNTALNINMTEEIGSPILSSDYNGVIGVNITEQEGYNKGILIKKSIEKFFNKDSIIKVIFQDLDFNKEYSIEVLDFFMFGELITSFYIQSNVVFDSRITFFFNNEEIPCYSTELLNFYNIVNGSRIFFQRKLYFTGKVSNIIFILMSGLKKTMIAFGNMTKKELISKFCLINKLLYREAIGKFRFFHDVVQIIPNDEIFPLKNGMTIEVLDI